ncbi:MAG TPA: YceI family protein [Anseongella sp.]
MATKWKIDPTHSEIQFKVRHLMISTVTGHFRQFNVDAETASDDFASASNVKFTADIDSITTSNEQRGGHLKSADFFDAEKYPQLKFEGSRYDGSGEEAKLHGQLTIKDVTRQVTLNVEYGGMVVDPYGQTKAGFTLDGKISRQDFGLSWNAVTEAGQVVVSDDIKLHAEVQLVKQAE